MRKYLILSSLILILNACGESSSTNSAPIANAGADQVVMVNHFLTIVGTGRDSDGTVVSYEWKKGETVLATTASFDYLATSETSETVVSPSISSDIGTDILTLTVTDDDGAKGTDEVKIRVIEEVLPNSLPTANAGEDKYIGYSESVALIGEGTDSDGEVVSYVWKIDNYVLAETATLIYRPSDAIRSPSTREGMDELTLVVTDNDGGQGIDKVRIEFYNDSGSSDVSNCSEIVSPRSAGC